MARALQRHFNCSVLVFSPAGWFKHAGAFEAGTFGFSRIVDEELLFVDVDISTPDDRVTYAVLMNVVRNLRILDPRDLVTAASGDDDAG
jgi:hypothetical protein